MGQEGLLCQVEDEPRPDTAVPRVSLNLVGLKVPPTLCDLQTFPWRTSCERGVFRRRVPPLLLQTPSNHSNIDIVFIQLPFLIQRDVQIVHLENTVEDQGSEGHRSNIILVVRVKERFLFTIHREITTSQLPGIVNYHNSILTTVQQQHLNNNSAQCNQQHNIL